MTEQQPLNSKGRTYTSDVVLNMVEFSLLMTGTASKDNREYFKNKRTLEVVANYEEFMTMLHVWFNEHMDHNVVIDSKQTGPVIQVNLYFGSTIDVSVFDDFIWKDLRTMVLAFNPELVAALTKTMSEDRKNAEVTPYIPQVAKPKKR